MQRAQMFRCTICSNPYAGFEQPTKCPFCGAHERYFVISEDWSGTGKVSLTEQSRMNLEVALKTEVTNAEFYLCASRKSGVEDSGALFKALYRICMEHGRVISRMLGSGVPEIGFDKDLCDMSDEEMLEDAGRRESRTVKLYSDFLRQATNRLKQIFTAFVEVASDHIDLIHKEISSPAEISKESNDTPPTDQELNRLDRHDADFYDSYVLHED